METIQGRNLFAEIRYIITDLKEIVIFFEMEYGQADSFIMTYVFEKSYNQEMFC